QPVRRRVESPRNISDKDNEQESTEEETSTYADTTVIEDSFNITLLWETDYPLHLVQAIEDAAREWENVITEGLQDGFITRFDLLPGWDQSSSTTDTLWVDDLVVVVRLGERTPPNRWTGYVRSSEGLVRTEETFTQDVGLPLVRFIYMPNNASVFEEKTYEPAKWLDADIMKHTAVHEIGHCLGLVPSNNAERHPNMYAIWGVAVPPELASYVPSTGSDWAVGHWGYEHPALSGLGVRTNSLMGPSLVWWQQYLLGHVDSPHPPDLYETHGSITTLDLAALADQGYTVDMSAGRPLIVVIDDPSTGSQEPPSDYPPHPYNSYDSGKAVASHWHQH
ncbi:MAG: hypothetical protein OXI24_21390, partial [Candidatus Poribacteria bacterium]|nr:hypothetical protein [Candidatus Poribacteria bacterium]